MPGPKIYDKLFTTDNQALIHVIDKQTAKE